MSDILDKLKKRSDEFMLKQKRQSNATRLDKVLLLNKDMYYTDAEKYADQYYGDVYRATTKYDNDWD